MEVESQIKDAFANLKASLAQKEQLCIRKLSNLYAIAVANPISEAEQLKESNDIDTECKLTEFENKLNSLKDKYKLFSNNEEKEDGFTFQDSSELVLKVWFGFSFDF